MDAVVRPSYLPFYDVQRDFGAKGDGTTDDGPAIRSAIASNRLVYFPAGTYRITSACAFSSLSNVNIVGSGVGLTILKADASSTFANSMLAFTTCDRLTISGITFDQNSNASFTAAYPVVIAISSTNVRVNECEFINHTYIGLALDSCTRFWIERSRFVFNVPTGVTTNYNINISSSITTSADGMISRNVSSGSQIVAAGYDIQVVGNLCSGSKYGGAIAFSGNGTVSRGAYVCRGNYCFNNTGLDHDGVYVCGIEIEGYYCTVSGNICIANSGNGIASLAQDSIISGNLCLGNGLAGGGAQFQVGIAAGYISATRGHNNSIVTGNDCRDIGSGSQLYGYYEQGACISPMVSANRFEGNITGPVFLQGVTGNYDVPQWESYTPTMTSSGGTITTVGARAARFRRVGKMIFWESICNITTNGTGSGKILITLPTGPGTVGGSAFYGQGRGNGVSGKMLLVQFAAGAVAATIANYDDTYPGSNGEQIAVTGFYEVL